MKGFASIGAIYYIRNDIGMVVENNSNDNTTILEIISDGPKYGEKIKADASVIYEAEPIGPVFPANGEIVIENGREFVKGANQKVKTKKA